jgi:predicted phage-related endonuclease
MGGNEIQVLNGISEAERKAAPSAISDRRSYIGGSDARTVMGSDEAALIRLWREKRGEVEPEDLSRNLLAQFGLATEELNRRWFEGETGRRLVKVQRFVRHKTLKWIGATLDGMVEEEAAVFEAKFMLPWAGERG